MSAGDAPTGPKLMAFIDAHLAAVGSTRTELSLRSGISTGSMTRWTAGENEPTVRIVQRIAEALPPRIEDGHKFTAEELLQVMVQVDRPETYSYRVITPSRPVSVEDAIERDPALTERQRDMMWAALQAVLNSPDSRSGSAPMRRRPRQGK